MTKITNTILDDIPFLDDTRPVMEGKSVGYPDIFRIPYQFAATVFNNETGSLNFIERLKTKPSEFYHTGTSFSTPLDADNAITAFCEQDIGVDMDHTGYVYEVHLVFRLMDHAEVGDIRNHDTAQRMREVLKENGFGQDDIDRFVQLEHRKSVEPLETDDEYDDVEKSPAVHSFFTSGQEEYNEEYALDLLRSSAAKDKEFCTMFFQILNATESTKDGVYLMKKPNQRKMILDSLSTLYPSNALKKGSWQMAVKDFCNSIPLGTRDQNTLRNLDLKRARICDLLRFLHFLKFQLSAK